MRQVLIAFKVSMLVVVLVLITGCPTQLAPLYDKLIVDGVTTTNKDIMTLFASASSGTTANSFPTRAESYSKVIGGIDALAIQTKARPVPQSGTLDSVNKVLEKRGVAGIADDEAPSATALDKISKTLAKMRDTDRKQGLTATEVQAFKNQTSIYMDQAITYESFLQR